MTARFADLGAARLRREAAYSGRMGGRDVWSTVEKFPLYAGEYWIARNLMIVDLLRSTLDVPGDVAEFGSWKGANVVHLAKLLRVYKPGSGKRVLCFDSFQGLQTMEPADGTAERLRGQYQGSVEHLRAVIELFELERELLIHQGEITATLPRVLAAEPALHFSFVYVDVDLYRPTLDILENLHARLNPGGLFVIDEYGFDEFPGETQAVDEFLARRGDHYETTYLRATRQPSLTLRRRPCAT